MTAMDHKEFHVIRKISIVLKFFLFSPIINSVDLPITGGSSVLIIGGFMTNKGIIVQIVFASIVLILLSSLTGCSGMGIKGEVYRIDDRRESSSTDAMPLKCLFTECREANHGN